LFCVTPAARQAAVDLQFDQCDHLAFGSGFRRSLKEPVNQEACVALVSSVAGIDGNNLLFCPDFFVFDLVT